MIPTTQNVGRKTPIVYQESQEDYSDLSATQAVGCHCGGYIEKTAFAAKPVRKRRGDQFIGRSPGPWKEGELSGVCRRVNDCRFGGFVLVLGLLDNPGVCSVRYLGQQQEVVTPEGLAGLPFLVLSV